MPFDTIENCKSQAIASVVPPAGVLVQARKLKRRDGNGYARYIKIQIGKELARKLVLQAEKEPMVLAAGTGRDAGDLRLQVDHGQGDFIAKRDKRGQYSLTINERSAEGLFALEFPAFSRREIEPVHARGEAPALVFAASESMLAVPD